MAWLIVLSSSEQDNLLIQQVEGVGIASVVGRLLFTRFIQSLQL